MLCDGYLKLPASIAEISNHSESLYSNLLVIYMLIILKVVIVVDTRPEKLYIPTFQVH